MVKQEEITPAYILFIYYIQLTPRDVVAKNNLTRGCVTSILLNVQNSKNRK